MRVKAKIKKIKAKKILTPGSKPVEKKSGRPRKEVIRIGTARKLNYRTTYEQEFISICQSVFLHVYIQGHRTKIGQGGKNQ